LAKNPRSTIVYDRRYDTYDRRYDRRVLPLYGIVGVRIVAL